MSQEEYKNSALKLCCAGNEKYIFVSGKGVSFQSSLDGFLGEQRTQSLGKIDKTMCSHRESLLELPVIFFFYLSEWGWISSSGPIFDLAKRITGQMTGI